MRILVWGDLDQIEARVLPWLSASPGGDAKLDIFRRGEDVYRYSAMAIYGLGSPEQVQPSERQIGKVAELSLGFGGSAGAFSGMGKNYGLVLDSASVSQIVADWRLANAWCVKFWWTLWNAMLAAHKRPGTWVPAGRVKYIFHPDMMYGTMICRLPSGRWIVYPQFTHEWTEWLDKDDVEREGMRTSFRRSFGSSSTRIDLWYGMLAENATQAVAADLLRQALVRLQDIVVLHTHDEVVVECDASELKRTRRRLKKELAFCPPWAEGLPISCSIDHGPFYSK